MANKITAKIASEKFHREPKEATTEPSVDRLAHEGMKKGGRTHKAMGGLPVMPRRRAMAMQPALLTRKHGGKAEGGAEHRAEMKEMHKIEHELKSHEHQPAHKAHHGLKKGGKPKMYEPMIGGLLGEGMPHHKGKTGAGVEGSGFKHGGKAHHISGHPVGSHKHHMHMAKHHAQKHAEGGSTHHRKMHEHHKEMAKMCKAEGGTMPMVTEGGAHLKHGGKMHHKATGGLAAKGDKAQTIGTLKPKVNVQDKVSHTPKHTKMHAKTGGIELEGYKRGGKMHKFAKGGTVSESVANKHLDNMQDGSKKHTKAGKTGEVIPKSNFKKGGHVEGHVMHHTTYGHHDAGHTHMKHHAPSKQHHGHESITAHPMKHGGHAKSKISTHHKKGGKCNY